MLAEFGVEGQFDNDDASYTYVFVAPEEDERLRVTFRTPYPFVHVTMWIRQRKVVDITMDEVDSIRIANERGARYLLVAFAEKRHLPKLWIAVEPHFAIHSGSWETA